MSAAFDLLKTIEQQIEKDGAEIPAETGSGSWQAVAFEQAGASLLLDMAQVREVLPLPPYTRLPGVKNWVVGISNVRGQILPIIDFGSYLEQAPSRSNPAHRVLVVKNNDVELGLMVDRVLGMKQQVDASGEASSKLDELPDFVEPYCDATLNIEGNQFGVFRIDALLQNATFGQIVVT